MINVGAKIYKSPKWEAEDVTPPALGVPQPVDHPLTPFPVNPNNLQTTGTIPPKPQNYEPIKVDKILSQARKLVEDEWNLAFEDLPALEDYLQSKNLMVPPVKTLVSLFETIDKWTEDEVREIARLMINDQEEGIDPQQDNRIKDAVSEVVFSKLRDAGYYDWKDSFFTHSEEQGVDGTNPYEDVTPVIPETNYPFGDMSVCPICNTIMRRVEWQGREWFTCPIHGPQRAPHRNAPYWKEKDTRSQYQPTKDKGYRPEEVGDNSLGELKQSALKNVDEIVENARSNPTIMEEYLAILKRDIQMYVDMLVKVDDLEMRAILEEVIKKMQTGVNELEMVKEMKEEGGIANFVPNPFKCPLCSEGFKSKEELDAHTITHYAGPLHEEYPFDDVESFREGREETLKELEEMIANVENGKADLDWTLQAIQDSIKDYETDVYPIVTESFPWEVDNFNEFLNKLKTAANKLEMMKTMAEEDLSPKEKLKMFAPVKKNCVECGEEFWSYGGVAERCDKCISDDKDEEGIDVIDEKKIKELRDLLHMTDDELEDYLKSPGNVDVDQIWGKKYDETLACPKCGKEITVTPPEYKELDDHLRIHEEIESMPEGHPNEPMYSEE